MKLTEQQVGDLAQFIQIARRSMERKFADCGIKLLELDMGVAGKSKNLVIIPGAERYFLKGSVVKDGKITEFRSDFAMALGDTTEDGIAELVDDIVVSTTARVFA